MHATLHPLRRTRPFLLAGLLCLASAAQAVEPPCPIGAYRLADRSTLDIAPSEGKTLRWRHQDGRSGALTEGPDGRWTSTLGWTGRPDGHVLRFPACGQGRLEFDGQAATRIELPSQDSRFEGDGGTPLAGRLVLPPGSQPVPIVVLLHGAERDGALELNSLQRRLPALGIGAFVYDKRGTGASGGKYTQDFPLLARDAVAALREARRLAGPRAGRIGYQGPSQGGWVAPIAAHLAPVDFVIVGFGLAVSVLEEDRSAVVMNLQAKGHGRAAIAQGLALSDAAGELVQNPTPEQFERFAALREKFRPEPWFKHAHGNFLFMLMNISAAEFEAAKSMLEMGTPWRYDPMPTITALNTPQLWMLAQDDVDAPSADTARLLEGLRTQGRPVSVAMFPKTEHGVYEYETAPDGRRLSTRHPAGYLDMMADFARGGPLKPRYGAVSPSRPLR